jgi:hypothetical protein
VIYILVHVIVFLVGVLLVRSADAVLQGIGSSLVATGIAGWFVLAYVAMTQRVSERLSLLEDSGILRVFPARSVAIRRQYEERITKAKEGIDVIGFGLKALLQDFGVPGLRQWASVVDVRILLMDPDFPRNAPLVSLRDDEEKQSHGTIADEVKRFVRECTPLLRDPQLKFRVRLYTVLPAVNYFRVDDEAFWGPYLMLQPSRNTPTLLVRRGGILYEKLRDHFGVIWSKDEFSRSVPESWLGP